MSHRPLLATIAASALLVGATTGALANDPELPESEPTGVEEPAELHIIEDAVMFDDVDDDGSTQAGETTDEDAQQALLVEAPGDDLETQDHPDNHGQDVSQLAHDTELEGRERGQAIAALARSHGESQRAGATGSDDAPGNQADATNQQDETTEPEPQPEAEDEDLDNGDGTDDDSLDDDTDDTDDADDTEDTDDEL